MITPVFLFMNEANNAIVVCTAADWNYSPYEGAWLDQPELDNNSFVPDVEQIDQKWVFPADQEGEEQALRKVAELYREQLDN